MYLFLALQTNSREFEKTLEAKGKFRFSFSSFLLVLFLSYLFSTYSMSFAISIVVQIKQLRKDFDLLFSMENSEYSAKSEGT